MTGSHTIESRTIECLVLGWPGPVLARPVECDVCVRSGNNPPRGQCVKAVGMLAAGACYSCGSAYYLYFNICVV